MVTNLFEDRQNLNVLEKALRDLLALGIVGKILEAENLSLSGQRKLRIEGGPVDFVAQLDAGEHNPVRVKVIKELLKVCPRDLWIGKRERMSAPHGGEHIGLVGSCRGVGSVLWSNDQLDANALRGGALSEINALVIVRDTAADDSHVRRFELAEESILIGDAGAQGVDHIHAYNHLLRRSTRRCQEENRCEESRPIPPPFCAAHTTLPDDHEGAKIHAVTGFQRRLSDLNTIELSKFCF